MIPNLYESNEESFTSNGLGRLSEAISCIVTEERNGIYELVMDYPITGMHYSDIEEEKIILATPSEGIRSQPFRIYRIEKLSKGTITVYANHIRYDLKRNTVRPFNATSCADALNKIKLNAVERFPFNVWTDKETQGAYSVKVPTEAVSLLGGTEGSILDVYGSGEYEFDRFDIKLHSSRGQDNGVTLRYGKNITELKNDTNTENIYTGVVPYWTNTETGSCKYGNTVYSAHSSEYAYRMTVPMDFTDEFDEEPTTEQLEAKASSYLTNHDTWKINQNIKVSFVALWQTEEYKDVAPLEHVKLCDTVHVYHKTLGVECRAKVIKTAYNVLLERYNSVEIGDVSNNNLSSVINKKFDDIDKKLEEEQSGIAASIKKATDMITGGLGGYVVISQNANGQPEEILVMDHNTKESAVNVIRINQNGIGFSTSGYQGPFTNAWTIDGHLLATFIQGGTFDANLMTVNNLEVGTNVSMGPNATITWSQVTGTEDVAGKSDIPSNAAITQITKDTLRTENVEANNLVVHGNSKLGEWSFAGDTIFNGIAYTGAKDSNSTGIGSYGSGSDPSFSPWAFWAGNGRFTVQQNGYVHMEHADASNISITGGNIKLGGTTLEEEQYIYLAGTSEGCVYESGFNPSQIFMYSSNNRSISVSCNHINIGYEVNGSACVNSIYPDEASGAVSFNGNWNTEGMKINCLNYGYKSLTNVIAALMFNDQTYHGMDWGNVD